MPKRIAIVEDDPDQRGNYTDALERRGFAVDGYPSRPEALAGMKEAPPDLAILDIMLGEEMDGGFDLCRELLARDPELPVIFLTSRADDIDRISGLRLGAWDYQAKPVSLAFLAEIVAKRNERGASYDDLARATRQGVVENNTVNTHVLHLRNKFRKLDPAFDGIKSVYGFGYRWNRGE